MIDYPPDLTIRRARTLIRQAVEPFVFTDHHPLEVAAYQCEEPISHAQAVAAEYKPVELGFVWGPIWSTAWFRLRGSVPAEFDGSFRLMFDTRTEALCWWDGAPYQGVELHRQDVKLPDTVRAGDALEVYVEAACNHMTGVAAQFSDPSRTAEFPLTQSGKLTLAHVARHHPDREALLYDVSVLADLAEALPETSARRRQVAECLRGVCNAIDVNDLDGSIPAARALCAEALAGGTAPSANTAFCVGNAHIDLAWLWPIRETKRKASRSFSTVLRYMERHPEYHFVQSQPQLYEWVRQDYPDLFKGIQDWAAKGQWEPAGAMWVEADCNIPSGESLVRQLLCGIRYFEKWFGAKQRFLWLPDVFGYSAAMPQILKKAGVEAFITQKISWNQFNRFPAHSFRWVGIDGTSIPSHFLPADTYIGDNRPQELLNGDQRYKQSGVMPGWLQAYGWGDGGGGPTEDMIERVNRLGDCDGLPRAKHTNVERFVDFLLEKQDDLPEWAGELYLELHRGTYTSQSYLKRGNRMGERLLREVELAQAILGASDQQREAVDRLWKDLLLNQFHDILPGSSIEWVNREAKQLHDAVASEAKSLAAEAMANIAPPAEGDGPAQLALLNTRSQGACGLVEFADGPSVGGVTQTTTTLDGESRRLAYVSDSMAGPGIAFVSPDEAAEDAPTVSLETRTLENKWLRATFDEAGRVVSLLDKTLGRDVVPAGQFANELVLYEDRPVEWDAWDVEVYYREKGSPVAGPAEVSVVEEGPLRVALEFRRPLGQGSRLVQRAQLASDGRWVEFDTWVDWQEERTLLRVLHAVDVHTDHASFEIQYGYVRRPNHFNTSWDYARFESVAHRWADISEPGFGVTMLNDCKYGHSCHGQVLGLSLLRSPNEPDPTADRGEHRFRYALMPHAGFDAAPITSAAEAFNQPVTCWLTNAKQDAPGRSPVQVTGAYADAVVVEAIKPAEEGQDLIVRLREARGGRGSVVLQAQSGVRIAEVDLLERPLADAPAPAAGQRPIDFTPFDVRTFRLSETGK